MKHSKLMFATADRALFEAKRGGRDRVRAAERIDRVPRHNWPLQPLASAASRSLRKLVLVLRPEHVWNAADPVRAWRGGRGPNRHWCDSCFPSCACGGALIATGRAMEGDAQLPFRPAWAEVVAALHELGVAPAGNSPLLSELVPALVR